MIDDPTVSDPSGVAALGRVTTVLTALVDSLGVDRQPMLTPEGFLALAARCVPSGRHAVVAEADADRHPVVLAVADHVAARVAAVEAATGEGPMHDVLTVVDMAVSDDLTVEARWPSYGPRVVDLLGLRSVVAYRVRRPGRPDAVLSFLSDWPYAFDELSLTTGSLLALHCSLAALVGGERGRA